MAESIMLDKAKDFAVEIINMCKNIKETKRESVLTNQLMRSGTSIGANIHESKYAHGTADFVSKMQIALKECYESEYWLELLNRTDYIEDETYKSIVNSCGQIRRMFFPIASQLRKLPPRKKETAHRRSLCHRLRCARWDAKGQGR